jgi:hypothetical protein
MDHQVNQLMLVEYRYIRLAFHPILHKFLIIGQVHIYKKKKKMSKYLQQLIDFGKISLGLVQKILNWD